jgi:hypothetical protein
MTQTINNLPAGYYKMSANLGGNGTYISLNNKTASWTEDKDYTVGYVLGKDEPLTITAGKTAEGTANWIHFDNFRLHYCGDVAASLNELRQQASAIANSESKMSSSKKTVLNTAIQESQSATTLDDILASIDNLTEAMSQANASIAKYVAMSELIAKATAYVNNSHMNSGKADLNDAISTAQAAYNAGASELNDEISALQTAINTFTTANMTVFNGKYYVQHVESGLYMAAGNDYGTRAIVNGTGLDLTLAGQSDATVTFDSQVSNGGDNHFLGSGLYMDAPKAGWQIVPSGDDEFTISNGTQFIGIDNNNNLALTNSEVKWKFLAAADVKAARTAALAAATEQTPVDATFLLQNPNFNRNDQRVSAWSVSNDCTNKNLNGGNGVNNCAESYHSTFTISQTVTGIPNGIYEMTAQGFYRIDGSVTTAPVFFANEQTAEILPRTGTENDMAAASVSFANGNYTIAPIRIIVTDGKLEVGAKQTDNMQWVIFDNFTLKYIGAIAEKNSLSDFENADETAILTFSNYEVLNAGSDSIVAQSIDGSNALGVLIKGTEEVTGAASAVYGTKISGQLVGTYDAEKHLFTVLPSSGNKITATSAAATANEMTVTDAANANNAYLLTTIKDVVTTEHDDNVYLSDGETEVKLDKRLAPTVNFYGDEAIISITGVTFVENGQNVMAPLSQSSIQSNKAESAAGDSYAQGEKVSEVDGMVMTYGGNDAEGQPYEFIDATGEVAKFSAKTLGINSIPVDADDLSYNPSKRNLPTKGTYYVFEPTKDGQLEVTVDLEAGKRLYFTEGDRPMDGYNGVTSIDGNKVTATVKATKTYYLFANETNLTYYGFSFKPTSDNNIAKDIATFKTLSEGNTAGDTLLLKDAVVNYVKGDEVYVSDATGSIVIYQTKIRFEEGQVLNGYIIGQNGKLEGYIPALLNTDATQYGNFSVTGTVTPEPQAAAIADVLKTEALASFVKLEELVVAKDDNGKTILTDGENSLSISNHFEVYYELNDTVKTVEAIVGTDADGNYQLWPTSEEGIVTVKIVIPEDDAPVLADGKYVLKNVASGLFWGAGNNWGTRASLLDYSEYQTLSQKPDGTYKLESQVSNGGDNIYFEGDFMDNANPKALTITKVTRKAEEVVNFDGSFYHNWSEVSGTAADNGSANGGVKLNEEVGAGGVLWGNLTGAVPFKDYADLTDYEEMRFEGTPGATLRLMCNRVVDEGPIYEIQPKIGDDGKLTVKISDLKFLNGGTPCDFVALQGIKIPWGGAATQLKSIKLVKSAEKTYYTIADGESCYGNSTEAGSIKGTYILGKGLSADDENALWEIIPASAESLAAATESEPMDATYMILNPNFGRNNRNDVWTMDASNQNLKGGFSSGTNENQCAESWKSAFTLSQTINVLNGVYALTAQAALTDYANLYDGNEYPVVYANEETAPFNNMEGSDIASNMTTLGKAFSNGNYNVGPIYVKVTNGQLTIGVKGTRTDTWCIWDNFQLTYYGANVNIDDLKGGAEAKELETLRKKAGDLMADVEVATVKTALQDALSQTATVSGSDAIKNAISVLTAAVEKGEASKTGKNVLPKMKELTEKTNFYTQEAYNQYYGTWLAKYENGTLTKAEAAVLQDPTVVTGWHAQNTVDDLLLSTWDAQPEEWATYHINTWSVEGDTDGSDFRVPFFEYWTGDGESLGEKVLTGTMNGLAQGSYDVQAWVRVRIKNGAETPATGITMQVNNGTAVDVTAGDQVGTSQFYLKEYTATGTVGSDGVLTLKFNVAADNNISWLSFRDVKILGLDNEAEVLYSWESPEGTPAEQGGKIEYVNGEGNRLNYLNSDYYTICLNGKKANIDETTATANAGHMVVTLDEALEEGDVIAITAFVNKDSSKKSSAYILYETGANDELVYSDEANINEAIGGTVTTKTTTVTAAAAGSKTIKLTRGQTGTNLFITKLEITRGGATGISETVAPVRLSDGAIYKLNGVKVGNTTEGLKPGLYIKNGKKVIVK